MSLSKVKSGCPLSAQSQEIVFNVIKACQDEKKENELVLLLQAPLQCASMPNSVSNKTAITRIKLEEDRGQGFSSHTVNRN